MVEGLALKTSVFQNCLLQLIYMYLNQFEVENEFSRLLINIQLHLSVNNKQIQTHLGNAMNVIMTTTSCHARRINHNFRDMIF